VLFRSVVGQTLQTATDINDSAQQAVQETVKASSKIIQGAVQTTAKLTNAALDTSVGISTEALKTLKGVTTDALGVVDVNSKNAASIVNKGGTEGTKVINEALQQSGELAVRALSTTGTSLQVLIGSANNVSLEKLQRVNATRDVLALMTPAQRITALKNEIVKLFNDRLNDFIRNLKHYSSTQTLLIREQIELYKLMNCKTGIVWGHNCSKQDEKVIQELKNNLNIVERKIATGIRQLEGIKSRTDSLLLPIYSDNNTEANFQEKAHVAISPLYTEAGALFLRCTNDYNQLSKMLENKMNKSIDEIKIEKEDIRRVEPVTEVVRTVQPVTDVVRTVQPVTEVVRTVQPVTDVVRTVQPVTDVVRTMEPVTEEPTETVEPVREEPKEVVTMEPVTEVRAKPTVVEDPDEEGILSVGGRRRRTKKRKLMRPRFRSRRT
jgi:hypothetical protein